MREKKIACDCFPLCPLDLTLFLIDLIWLVEDQ